jgi:hypothetical protein
MLPPVPLMANLSAPSGAALGTEIVRMDFPAPGAGTGLAPKDVPEPPDMVIAEWTPLPTFVALVGLLKSDPKGGDCSKNRRPLAGIKNKIAK